MRISLSALAMAALAFPHIASAEETADQTIVVTAPTPTRIDNPPSTKAIITAGQIAQTVNAVSVEDTLKYAPSLVIRKRSIGDTFAPIATRTSGLGASARSLIYADGALLSALIANNNGNGSPRWTLVTPEEIDSIEVLYGPFSAAYPGNSIGAVVNITTRMPDRLEARATALSNVQTFSLYGTDRTLPSWQVSGSVGDRIGALSFLLSATRTEANSQPISFTTLTGTTTTLPPNPSGTIGGSGDVNKLNQRILVLGAGGLEHHVQETYKAKLALDLAPGLTAAYVLGIFRDKTQGAVDSYEQSTAGGISYATGNTGATTGFNSAVYTRDALHFSHALSLTQSGGRLDWQVIGTLYRYAHDLQNNPSPDASSGTAPTGLVMIRNDLPAAFTGGAGTVQRQNGTGWGTLDAKAALRLDGQTVSLGAHADRETLNAQTYTLADWLDAATQGQLRSSSRGQTRTLAVWAQDAIRLAPQWSLTLGGRQEWWRAYGGSNATLTSSVNSSVIQPESQFSAFSPKASLEWKPAADWNARLSFGQAWRMPTVGELYQVVTVGTQLANPNPNLRPERARSEELAITHATSGGSLRLSLFNEVVKGALISQLDSATNTTYVQNVDRTRARGVELAAEQRNILPHVDLSASLTYADAITSQDTVFPAAVGKLLPSVPRWKGNAVVTWHPTRQIDLTAALRFASRNYANLDNSDVVGNTYQGFYRYAVVDLRARFAVDDHFSFALGVDNVNNDKYFLFHPFPQRNFTAQIDWKL